MNKLVLSKTIQINANKEKVWEAIINPNYTKQYMFNLEVKSNWKEGDAITWKGNYNGREIHRKGKILRIEPIKMLQITDFGVESGLDDKDENYSRITYQLYSISDITELKIIEDHFNNDE